MKSVVSYPERGLDGKNSYRGNCSGKLIEDIIQQYSLQTLADYMVGSGTTEDVCRRKGISGYFTDLNRGYDMVSMDIPERAGNIFWHPPYDNIIVYSDEQYSAQSVIDKYGFDPRINDLSRCKDWDDFVSKMNYCLLKQYSALDKGGRIFVLMGDIKKKGKLYSMLCDIAKPGTLEQIIIKMQHNCFSDNVSYSGRFVPIVHEYLMVLRKDASLIYPVSLPRKLKQDLRDSVNVTWRDLVAAVLEDRSKELTLREIYRKIDGHKKCENNINWQAKIRQVLQSHTCFVHVSKGCWAMAA